MTIWIWTSVAVAVVSVAALHSWKLAREGGIQPIFVAATRSMERETHFCISPCPDPTGTESALLTPLFLSGLIFLLLNASALQSTRFKKSDNRSLLSLINLAPPFPAINLQQRISGSPFTAINFQQSIYSNKETFMRQSTTLLQLQALETCLFLSV